MPPAQQHRWAWWALGAISLALLLVQSLDWLHGRRALQALLNPAGLLCLSCGSLLHRQPLRGALITIGVLLMLVALCLRYLF